MGYPTKSQRKKKCPRCGKYVPTYATDCYDCDWDFDFVVGSQYVGKKRCPRCGEMIPNEWNFHTCGWKF